MMTTIGRRLANAVLLLGLWSAPAFAQSVPPSTEIFLVPLTVRNERPVVGVPANVTRRAGYDNQPSFSPDSRTILFTSVRQDGQADIYRYDLQTRTTTRVTATPESEYSATVYGTGKRFSVIRVERDSTQRLWSFALDGTDPELLFEGIKPVGYHAWVDSTTVALFILGTPNALVLADTRTGRADTVARDVGRSLLPLPNGNGFSFIQRRPDSSWVLTAVDVRHSLGDRQTMMLPLVRMPTDADYVVWFAPAVAISSSGTKLLLWRRERGAAAPRWSELADLGRYGLHKISRLALSPNHRWLAIVAEPVGSGR